MRTIRIIEHITLDGVIQAGCPTHSRVSNEWDREAEYVILSGHS